MNLDTKQELDLLIAISESIDEWAQPDYGALSEQELLTIIHCEEKQDQGEQLTQDERETLSEAIRKTQSLL